MPEVDSPRPVLDASALLAHLRGEQGGESVKREIASGAKISAANLAEALSTLAILGRSPTEVIAAMERDGLMDGALTVEPVTEADAIEAARLRPITKSAGLSLGDRLCLALAARLEAPAMTGDGEWLSVELDVEVINIREASP